MNSVREKSNEISELKDEIDVLKSAQVGPNLNEVYSRNGADNHKIPFDFPNYDPPQTDPNRRGNSIFAEVEDRRLAVEAKLATTSARLRVAEEARRRLKNQLAQSYASMQVLASHTSQADTQ